MNTLSSRVKILLILALVMVGLFLADRLVINPLLQAWRLRNDEIVALRAQVERGSLLLDQENRWRELERQMHDSRLPAAADAAQSLLLGRLDTWARETGPRLSAMRPRGRQTDARTTLEIQVTGDGSMRQIVDFVYAIESAPLAIAVDQLTLNTGRQRQGVLEFDLRLSALCREERP